ncbi:MAG TPA: hypothetical protein VHE30_04245 [Polyangiaceae bacterium]|nr:hypothetical protein [Polyangiaceae bacterium]
MKRESELLDVAIVLAVKATVSLVVLATGFFAISDDDFSRTVIAMNFAHAPRFDPSGTSWLPAPFWISGTAMTAFGRSLEVARVVAFAEGLAFALLVRRGARAFGLERPVAAIAAVVATSVPTAARLSVSFQPEALTAGLVAFAAFASRSAPRPRAWAAAGLFVACLSRYEAWPAAATFAVLATMDARSIDAGRSSLIGAAALSVAGPILWILHGVAAHGDALFFLHRVAAYRAALGADQTPLKAFTAVPLELLLAEPSLVVGAIVLHFRTEPARARYDRPLLVLGSVLGFLAVGAAIDGAPTHHPERALLSIYVGLAVIGTNAAVRLVREARVVRLIDSVVAMALAGLLLLRVGTPERFANRAEERAVGRTARNSLSSGDRLLVDTPDYGYFAVIASFGAPERAEPVELRDPRLARAADAFSSADALRARIARARATALVVSRPHWEMADSMGEWVEKRSSFGLLRVRP